MSVIQTRADMRTSLQRKTDGSLTVEADLDYYLDLGELEVMADFYEIDRGIFSTARQSVSTDSSGVLLVPTTMLELFDMEDANETKYKKIKVENRKMATGWYPIGYDIASAKRKLQIVENGSNVGTKTMYFYNAERVTTGSSGSSEPIYPLEFRDLIPMKAAQLYYEDQDESYERFALRKENIYNKKLAKAARMYDRAEQWPEYAETTDYDAYASDSLQRRSGYLL